MKILYWNIRGVRKAAGLCALRLLVKEHAPDVLCLAEPMVQVCKFPVIFFSQLGYAVDFIHNFRDDKVPNLWIIWKLGVSRPVVAGMSDQYISVIFDWPGSKVGISFVHASSFKIMRRQLWLDLELSISDLVPWSVMGDFNATLFSHEKRGPGKFNLGSAAEFQAMVDACELLSIPSQGKKFTWTNNRRRGHSVAVLDRSFCNGKWIDVFRNVKQRVLVSSVSDHAPLMVVSDDVQRPTNIPFRFHSFWMENDQFISVVEEAWKTSIGGNPIFVLAQKLKQVKENLKVWARANFPNLNDEVDKAKLELKKVQDMIEVAGMNDELFNREADAKTVLLKANQMYEKLWAEKAKLRWMKNGDCNSKFFHLSVKLRRLKNQITSLKKEDGTWVSDQQGISSYVSDFFEKFHEADEITVHNDLLDNIPRVLEEEDVAGLESVPSGEEIKQAVWDLDSVSSPGPDGFPGSFFRRCWTIVEGDFCRAVKKFFEEGRLPKGINNCFISLIPKVEGAASLDRFRPICMGNFYCKVISKILSSRLLVVLPKLISEEQGAFQQGKIISANISLASELSNLMHSSVRGGGMGLKLDVQKAYDSLAWEFLFAIDGSLKTTYLSSSIWPGLKKVWRWVQSHEQWTVGNGQRINFWKDSWLGKKSIEEMYGLQLDIFDSMQAKVSDFICQDEWNFPQFGWMKQSIDDCSLGNPEKAGAGGLRDSNTKVISSFRSFLGMTKNFEAEVCGLIVGLDMAKDLSCSNLWIECDPTVVALMVQRGSVPCFVWQHWTALLGYVSSVQWKVSHCYYEVNSVVDYFARSVAKKEFIPCC
ncbi:uncharacterized protein LOC122093928 [Macadamia integrifolia]|uniref:uncharacterized protein LOC122093928 n=1 Tax=Macadamia integrifolia TaxID=60698 RepID=UPI001C52AEDF|nr:uncharacterized protein LOC122093928 [Macadamia integrifolia]